MVQNACWPSRRAGVRRLVRTVPRGAVLRASQGAFAIRRINGVIPSIRSYNANPEALKQPCHFDGLDTDCEARCGSRPNSGTGA